MPPSPSFDSEAASQQLLAEASSPVRRQTAAPLAGSIAAQRGATLLNAARALHQPLPAPVGRAGKLPKPSQPKPPKITKGKLPRASLAGLVSESSQKKARGKQLYDLGPSPQKKRSSLPPQIAALGDEEDDIVQETSQVQPDDDMPAEIPESLDVSAPTEAFGDDDIVDAPTSPLVPREEITSAAKKQRGRPRKSGDVVAFAPAEGTDTEEVALLAPFELEKETYLAAEEESAMAAGPSTIGAPKENLFKELKKGRRQTRKSSDSVFAAEEPTVEVTLATAEPLEAESSQASKKRLGRPRKSGDSVVSRASDITAAEVQDKVTEETSATPKKRQGRPRKSSENTTSRPSDIVSAEVDESSHDSVLQDMQTQHPAAAMKPKRKGRPGRDIDTRTSGEADSGTRPAKKVKKLKGPKMISPDEPEFEEDLLPPIATPLQDLPQAARKNSRQELRDIRRQERRRDAQPRGDPQPRAESSIRSTHIRSSRSQGEPATVLESSSIPAVAPKSSAAQRIAVNTRAAVDLSAIESARRKKTDRQIHISFHDPSPAAKANGEEDEEAAQQSFQVTRNGRRGGPHTEADDIADANNSGQGQENDDEDDEVQNDQSQGEENRDCDDANAQDDDEATPQRSQLVALSRVLGFADGEERSGVCTVGLAKKIGRACDRACVMLGRADCSYDDVARCKDMLVRRLTSIGYRIPDDTRFDFKRDAFAHLFRDLTLVLKAMYVRFQHEQDGECEIIESLDALRILHPLIREMLRFKDAMDSWKVKVQGQRQGDRLIKGVESDLISPLRIVERDFKMRLNALRKTEQDQQARFAIQQQQERQEQEIIRQEEAVRAARERRMRWQNLHIVRMQCESDPYRRRRLRFIEPPNAVETDADGNEFERVPLFGQRNAPPPSSIITTSGKEWTLEQDSALLDALQSFTGRFTCHITLLYNVLTIHSSRGHLQGPLSTSRRTAGFHSL